MPQIFHRSANPLSRWSLVAAVFLVGGFFTVGTAILRSPYFTRTTIHRDQPVPFSHLHHAGQLGIHCVYCHSTVEQTAPAGLPPTKTCMNCHSQIWTNAQMLEPVRASFQTDRSLEWERVHDLPDFVYFNHSIHINKGVACETCHGKVNEMPLTYQANNLFMSWCLGCHRNPEKFVRPRDAVFQSGWKPPPGGQVALGRKIVQDYHIRTRVECSTCHR